MASKSPAYLLENPLLESVPAKTSTSTPACGHAALRGFK